jgi:conjugal transfer ATP-binding protein TraC
LSDFILCRWFLNVLLLLQGVAVLWHQRKDLQMLKNTLAEKLEVWGFEDGKIIFKDFSLGSILEVIPKDISCATDEFLNLLHGATCDFLNGLPENLSIQFVQVIKNGISTLIERHATEFNGNPPELAKSLLQTRVIRFQELDAKGEIPNQKIYLVLRRPFVRKIKKERRKLFLIEKKDEVQDWPGSVLAPELKLFHQCVESVKSGLETLGINSKIQNETESFELLFDQWNPGHPVESIHFNSEDIRDELLLNDLVVSTKGFMLGQFHHRVLSLKIMPEQTFASMAERMRDLPFDSKLFLSIQVLDQAQEDLALQTQRRISYAMYAGKRGVSDLESAAKLSNIESVLAKRVSGETKIFSVALNVIIRHESESELEEQVAHVLRKFRELSGSEGMLESLAATSIFFGLGLPNARATERSRRMNTEVLADFLPIFGDWRGHEAPRVLLQNRQGGVIGFDPFSPTLTNFNQIVSGGSGAGKSYLTNLLLAQVMKEDPKVYIIDIGGSYKKVTENLGGQYIAIGSDSSLSINPFDLSEKTVEAIDQKIKFMTSLVELMTKEDEASGIGKLERSEIEYAIKEILAYEDSPRLSHLRSKLLENSEVSLQKMGKILGPWCGDSPFGKFVDQQSNFNIQNRVVCFDLKGLESQPDLQAVCLFLITDLIWREVQRDRTNPKFVVFDECWSLLENEAGGRFLGEVFRTFRKYRASAIAISQTMDDFANSKVASAILPNASIKWLLKQTGGNLPSLQKILRLNEREIKLIESITSKKGFYSEAFLIAGDDKQVVVIESTPLEYWLATTDPADLKALERAQLEFRHLCAMEILQLMAAKYPHGAII